MFDLQTTLRLTVYQCNLSPRNSYHISEEFFKMHKVEIKELVGDRRFDILSLRWEDQLTYKEIAEIYGISSARINQIVAKCCYLLKKINYQIKKE
ncbi:sigma factor-like helix-turn-helix DNA-binding protein [Kordia sp.]|uniref:sigma factor-like helix-turn-helix DNA-binding protein n=1 Tax=Kordia sp. TaxID=1965332 RepID=UPI00344FAAFF